MRTIGSLLHRSCQWSYPRSNRKNRRFYRFCIHLYRRWMIHCRSVSLRPLRSRIPRRMSRTPLKISPEGNESVIRIHCQSNTCPLHPSLRLRWFPLNRRRASSLCHSAFLGLIFFFRLFIPLSACLPVCRFMHIDFFKETWSNFLRHQQWSCVNHLRYVNWFVWRVVAVHRKISDVWVMT